MIMYLIPGYQMPVTLGQLRRAYPDVAWANADAGGPDIDALALVGGSVAPDQPAYDPLTEELMWDGSGWVVTPVRIFEFPDGGTAGSYTEEDGQ
ncbi:hypothetical protein [Azospirillum picis]|uniref:Uncharacterized protein n=1 Tax=Azospirillum picis TaxID=488438 RepID=A0ABU0MEI6_9PROT|nr:hypothetical protein [Azospirillum picis]MBP2297945.1 hypothetical protein [Azospirillum picis]MDQ0531783.1 hypothetical protein [Azospirillum picis]